MRFILVKCAGREAEFPNHVQWRATSPIVDIFFWIHEAEGEIGAKKFVQRNYPEAYFSDEQVH